MTPADGDEDTLADTPALPPIGSRRRLWELPAGSHDLLLAMSLSPAQLQARVERCLSRLRRARCRLAGSHADLLYSSVRDLGTRNALSEVLQRELETRHAGAVRTMARLREAPALRAAWIKALAGPDLPAALWALLTHPLGPVLEDAALVDARAWVYAQARAGVAAAAWAGRQNTLHAEAVADSTRLRARLTAAQAEKDQRLQALRSEVAQLRGALQRAEQVAAQAVAASPPGARTPSGTAGRAEPAQRAVPTPLGGTAPSPDPHQAPSEPAPLLPRSTAATTAQPRQDWAPAISGQRVLCVGGMPGAQRRYQAIVESGGGRFAWHDGGLEDNVQRLDQQLHSADLVVCQAGCLNHEAYRRIKGHCKRLGKPCVYLQRPGLSGFAMGLGLRDAGRG